MLWKTIMKKANSAECKMVHDIKWQEWEGSSLAEVGVDSSVRQTQLLFMSSVTPKVNTEWFELLSAS